MLMPLQVIREIQKRNYRIDEKFIKKHFGVSFPAAQKRVAFLKNRFYQFPEEKNFEDIIVEKFKSFINTVAPRKEEYSSCWDDPMQAERDSWY